jgi:DNA-binding response OmpR family regulator
MRILVVEDDAQVASFIRRGFREQQFAVDVALDGEQALFMAQTAACDLIVLDWQLPKFSGIDVLRTLRAQGVPVPVLVLTGRGDEPDKVQGFDAGADDYLTKPFKFEELLARARALLRRRSSLMGSLLRVGDLQLDSRSRRVTRGQVSIQLTNREYELLEYLMRHPGEIVTRTQLAEQVWEQSFDPFSNVIDVHVARLRRKIDHDFTPPLLSTVRGKGYTLVDVA